MSSAEQPTIAEAVDHTARTAGLTLTAEDRRRLERAAAYLREAMLLVRGPDLAAAEPATIFAAVDLRAWRID